LEILILLPWEIGIMDLRKLFLGLAFFVYAGSVEGCDRNNNYRTCCAWGVAYVATVAVPAIVGGVLTGTLPFSDKLSLGANIATGIVIGSAFGCTVATIGTAAAMQCYIKRRLREFQRIEDSRGEGAAALYEV
jgi:hypothetical protein